MARQTDIRLRRSAVSGSVPTTSNLNLGELALNTADGKVYMKKSVGGTDTVVEVGGNAIASTFTAYEYTATANQTTFSGSDNYSNTLAYNTGTPPKVQVFMNGILLDEGSSQDYTGTNGTSVVLTTGADAGDLIQIHAYKSDVSVSSNINFGDNKKLQFGDAQDLQIFHDGNNSRITDTGTGSLILRGANSVEIEDVSGENMLVANSNGAVELYHNNVKKFETTASGVQTTGTVNVNGAYTLPTSDGSSGQALVSDGSGTLSFATVSGGAVTSMSDTDGDTKIQVEESSDEDIIRFDTGGVERVRVGVDSSSDSTLEIVRNGVPANQGKITFNGSGLITDVTSGYHSLIVRNGGSEHFKVRSNGNVGIGESSPGQKLQVNGNIRADGHYYVGGQIVIDSNRRILAADGAANVPYITFAADTNTGLYRPGTDIIGFSTAGSERVRIDASGRVGINNSSPSSQYFNNLVVGDNSAGDKGITIRANSANKGVLAFSDTDSADANRYTGYIAYQHTDNSMRFHTNGGGERMRIKADGQVGIGTQSPDRKLHISGSGGTIAFKAEATDTSQASVDLKTSNSWFRMISSSGTLSFYDQADSAERLRIDTSGNVGIGTASPDRQLELEGQGVLRLNATGSNTDPGIDFNTASTNDMQIRYRGATDKLAIYSYGTTTDVVTIQKSNGNVGIGTSSPAADLHIENGSGATLFMGDTNGRNLRFRTANSGSQNTNISSYAGLYLGGADNQNHMLIDGNGRVGIGTTSPTHLLHVNGTTATILAQSTNAGSNASIWFNSNVGGTQANRWEVGTNISAGSSFEVYDRVNGTSRMVINSSGYLLVGKTDSSFTTNGTEIRGGNLGARVIRQNAEPLVLHRRSSDGEILNLYKDSAKVGSIGSNGTYPYIGSHGNSGKGLKITDALLPATNTGGFNDADVNLGASNVRWKDLYISGKAHIGHAVIDDYAVNTSATSAAQVDTFAAATFRTARYTIQITNTTDSTYHVTELLLIHDGTTPSITEYGTIYTGSASEATFDADIVSGNVRLLATPASSDTMQFRVVRHSILV